MCSLPPLFVEIQQKFKLKENYKEEFLIVRILLKEGWWYNFVHDVMHISRRGVPFGAFLRQGMRKISLLI